MKANDASQEFIKSNISMSGGCWNWNARKSYKGYGTVIIRGKFWFAHRLSYTVFVGEIPDGALICHKCDNPSCVNPDHLYAGTVKSNFDDMRSRGRYNAGFAKKLCPKQSKLNWRKVCEIRLAASSGVSYSELSDYYGVEDSLISRIVSRKIWRFYHPVVPWGGIKRVPKEKVVMDLYDRIIRHTTVSDDGRECLLWTGSVNKCGYGLVSVRRGDGSYHGQLAHREFYKIVVRDISPDEILLHSCDNRSCINPLHLRVGTRSENNADKVSKGRQRAPNGVDNGSAKLTEDDVRRIRSSEKGVVELASSLGVTRHTIRYARDGKTYKDVI